MHSPAQAQTNSRATTRYTKYFHYNLHTAKYYLGPARAAHTAPLCVSAAFAACELFAAWAVAVGRCAAHGAIARSTARARGAPASCKERTRNNGHKMRRMHNSRTNERTCNPRSLRAWRCRSASATLASTGAVRGRRRRRVCGLFEDQNSNHNGRLTTELL